MFRIYGRALRDAKYQANEFVQMLNEHGGIETATRLLPHISKGFAELWKRNRLDLTVEALVIKEPWRALFTREQLQIAEGRLRDFGYEGPWL